MSLLNAFISSPLVAKLGLVLLHSIWQFALVAVFLKMFLDWIGDRGRRSTQWRYSAAILGMVAVCVLPVLSWFAIEAPSSSLVAIDSSVERFHKPASPASAEEIGPPTHKTDVESNGATSQKVASSSEPAFLLPSIPFGVWISTAWILGLALFSFRPVLGFRFAQSLKRKSNQTAVPAWVEQSAKRLGAQLGLRRLVPVYESKRVSVPTVVGVLRPTVLLPLSCLTSLSAEELESILCHELAHIRRLDPLANFFQVFVETLFFYHPMVWWMSKIARVERENCCDDLAVDACGGSRSLISALLSLEVLKPDDLGSPVVLHANGGQLIARVKRLADRESSTSEKSRSLVPVVIAGLVLTMATLASNFQANAKLVDKSSPERVEPLVVMNESLEDRYQKVRIESTTELYEWDSIATTDPRLVHRMWNIATPELRNQPGRQIENWKPELLLHFTDATNGTTPQTVTLQMRLTDGFQWSIGNGVWDIPSQWPLRHTLAAIRRSHKNPNLKSDEDTDFVRESLFNNTAYAMSKSMLETNHHGKWVAIVDGRVLASFGTFEECAAAADKANRFASHRYLFRAGVDDGDTEFAYSPWNTGSPNWWQVGRQFRAENRIGVRAGADWYVGDKTTNAGNGKALIQLTAPSGESERLQRPAVASGMVTQYMTITEEDYRELKLGRYSVPGSARSLTYKSDCTKAVVRVSIPDLEVSQAVVAFVAPQSVVEKDPIQHKEDTTSVFLETFTPIRSENPAVATPNANRIDIIRVGNTIKFEGQPQGFRLRTFHFVMLVEGSELKDKIKVDFDERGGALVLSGKTEDIDQLEQIIVQTLGLPKETKLPSSERSNLRVLSDPVKIKVNPETNSIVFTGAPESVQNVKQLVHELAGAQIHLQKNPLLIDIKDGDWARVAQVLNLIRQIEQTSDAKLGVTIDTEKRQVQVQNLQKVKGQFEPNKTVVNDLLVLEAKLLELKEKYGPNHPHVVQLEAELAHRKIIEAAANASTDSAKNLALRQRILEAQLQLEEAKSRYGSGHPEVVRLKSEISRWRQFLNKVNSGESEQGNPNSNQERRSNSDAAASSLQAIRKQISILEAAKSQLQRRYGSGHPEITAITKQIEMWRKFAAALENEQGIGDDLRKQFEDSVDVPSKKLNRQLEFWKQIQRPTDDTMKRFWENAVDLPKNPSRFRR